MFVLALAKRAGESVKQDELDKLASETLKRHGLFTIPIDVVTLANREGIKVHNAKFSEDGVSGLVSRRGDNITLLVNQSDVPFRKRFTIAHELGHHFLHLMQDGDFVDMDVDLFRLEPIGHQLSENKRKEVEANQFAASILMPSELVIEIYKTTRDISKLAEIFNVSETAMGIRLGQLRLE
jgi:Zn-dependent peptidase ImmA (M78 family)